MTPHTPGRRAADVPVDSPSTTTTLELRAIQAEAARAAYVGRRRAAAVADPVLVTESAPALVPVFVPVPVSTEVQDHQDEIVSDANVARVLQSLVPVDHTTSFEHEVTAKLRLRPETPEPVVSTYVNAEPTTAGKRRAVKHAGSRGPLFRLLPSTPVLLGVAALAVSIGGVLTVSDQEPVSAAAGPLTHASALSGSSGTGKVVGDRGSLVSRDDSRTAQGDAAGTDLQAAAEGLAEDRNAALSELQAAAEKQAAKIELNLWQYPLDSVNLTARFGQTGLWASYHTGLDFNGNTGDQIHAIANGVVTEAGYDGSYGNKTVVTLEDGTELWYCHQTSILVNVGDTVRGGDLIGTVGATGHVTGSHLHVEVRPGGGDPVDPYAAMQQHGLF